MFEFIIKKYGKIDIVINNAGIYLEQKIDELNFEEWRRIWDKTIDTNLTAVANICYSCSQFMIKQKRGTIINVSSRGAFRGEPENPVYGASKAGLNSLSQSLAKYLGKYNINVAVVAPGFVETDMANDLLKTEKGRIIKEESPFKRVAKPEEVAYSILFLASKGAKFNTGAILDINGASYLRS